MPFREREEREVKYIEREEEKKEPQSNPVIKSIELTFWSNFEENMVGESSDVGENFVQERTNLKLVRQTM